MRKVFIVVSLLSAVAVAPSRPAHAATTPLPSNATVSVPGHGWGHGRGMGQWGAKGMADAGKTWSQIVGHYYSGVSITSRSSESIRVLVEKSSDVVVTSSTPFTAVWADGAKAATSSSTYPFLRARYDGTNYRVERAATYNGSWTKVAARASPVIFRPGTAMLQLVFNNGSVRYYRGSVIARYSSSDNMRSINEVLLEHYLYGVVPRESPSSWPAESLKAQAVAARTYAVYKKTGSRASGLMYDICATTMCQVYSGYAMKSSPSASITKLEHASTSSAISATAGKTLTYGGKPILAEFSSSTGGFSAPGSVPYQKPVPDAGDAASPHHRWTGAVKVSEIERRWPQVGRLVDAKVTKRNGYGDWGGRVSEMQLIGTEGSVTIGGGSWRSAFSWPERSNGVRSSWFNLLYWRGALESAPAAVSIVRGETKTVVARVKNTGTAPWGVGGNVRVATASKSRFASSSWISPTRAAAVNRNVTDPSKHTVAPGQVAEFRIPLATDSVSAGTYNQAFTMIADGTSPMALTFSVTVQVLASWIEDTATVLTNGSFEADGDGWTGTGLGQADGPSSAAARHGRRSMHLSGGDTKRFEQTVSFAGGSARRFTLGGWNRTTGSSATGGPVELTATARYVNGTDSTWRLPFARAPHAWQYEETSFATHPDKHLSAIDVAAVFANQTGDASFDSLRLVETSVVNGSFEIGLSDWTSTGLSAGDGASTADRRDGGRVLAFTGTGTKRVSQALSLSGSKGVRYVLSAWNRSVGSDPVGGPVAVTVTLHNTDGTKSASTVDFVSEEHDWTFGEAVVRAAKAFDGATLTISRTSQTGTQYFDDVRLVRTFTANPSFEQHITGWSTQGFGDDDSVSGASYRDGARSLRLGGTGTQTAFQQIPLAGPAGRRLVISGWSTTAGTTPGEGLVGVRLVFRNEDGSATSAPISFGATPHRWTYTERGVTAPKEFARVDVYVTFSGQTGSANFDAIRLRNV